MSFREFLSFEGIKDIAPISLEDILSRHREIAAEIVRGIKVVGLFAKYGEYGYYPFYKESPSGYYQRIIECINKVIESDLPIVEDVTPATIRKTKRMLAVLAESCPQEPNMKALYRELETDRNQGLKMLDVLERAELISPLKTEKDKLKRMSAPEKIYCDNVNLMRALVPRADIGTLRETPRPTAPREGRAPSRPFTPFVSEASENRSFSTVRVAMAARMCYTASHDLRRKRGLIC